VASTPNAGHRPDADAGADLVTNATPPSTGSRSITEGAPGPTGPIRIGVNVLSRGWYAATIAWSAVGTSIVQSWPVAATSTVPSGARALR
jgi:hypothetical protein